MLLPLIFITGKRKTLATVKVNLSVDVLAYTR
ncbi:MAG: hypothetical protein ACD_72C00382G0002 [uncultured bacterium]|nr:MAG: hypothetical protein ACD_72C00382G0002 [uncultured bacterium]